MNQAQPTIENEVMALSDANFEESVIHLERPVQVAHWDAESNPVTIEQYRLEGRPALLFFWDGKNIHPITDAPLKEEIARIIDNNL